MNSLCLVLGCAAALVFGPWDVSGQCVETESQGGYVYVLDTCEARDKSEAGLYCDSAFSTGTFDSTLATVWSMANNSALCALRAVLDTDNDYHAWIGATDAAEEGTWLWSDGSSVDYTAWFDGEPNDHKDNQDCAIMWKGVSQWDDQNCARAFNSFFCNLYEAPATPMPTPYPTENPTANPTPNPTPSPSTWNSGTWWSRN